MAGRARRCILERQFDAGACAAADRGEARHDDDGRAADLPLPRAAAAASRDADLSSLERAVVGGAPMPEALLETWAARGTAIVQGYGLTEAAPNVLCLPPEDAVRKLGYAGKPYPFVDVRLSRRGASCRCAARTSSPATGATREATARGVHRRRLAAHRRRRRVRRRGLLPDQGPPEGHVHLRRRERLPGRGRGRAARASAGRGRRRRRRRRTSAGARSASRSSSPTARPRTSWSSWCARAARAVQGAEVGALRRRDSAQLARARSRSRSCVSRGGA